MKVRPLAVAIFAVLLPVLAPMPAQARTRIYVNVAPPAPLVEVRTVAPSHHHVWVSGYHRWDDGRYVWVPGHYAVAPRHHSHWVRGHWAHSRRGWYWIDGHWR
jgi:hypothetical protein